MLVLASVLVPAGAAEKVTVKLKWRHQFQFAGYYAAQDKGFYREAGLEVSLLEGQAGVDATQSVLSGQAQYGVGNSGLLLRRAAGQPVVVLASIFQHSPAVWLKRRGEDGKPLPWARSRIMLAPNNGELLAYLKQEGVDLGFLQMLPARRSLDELIAGRIDAASAYATDAPFVLDRSILHYDVLSPRTVGIDFYGDVLYTTESELREHPARARAMRAATLRGWQYALEHPAEIVDLIRARYPDRNSREHLLYEASQTIPLLDRPATALGESNPARWRAIQHTYASLDMLKGEADLDDFLYQPPAAWRAWEVLAGGAAAMVLLLVGAMAWRLQRLRQELHGARTQADDAERMVDFALQGSGEGVWDWQPVQQRLHLSARYCAILGYAPDELRPANAEEWLRHVHEDDQPRVAHDIAALDQAQAEPAPFYWEFRMRCRDGGFKWVLARGMVIARGADGKPQRVSGTLGDIGDRTQAEEARLDAILAATPGPMLAADRGGRVRHANAACCQCFGYAEGQMAGLSLEQLVPDMMRSAPGGPRELFSRPRLPGRVLTARREDGSRFPAMVHLSPIQMAGQGLSVIALRDMTQRQRAEEALHASSERYRLIVQTAAEGIWMTDADDMTTFVNPTMARMLGYEMEEMLGHPIGQFMDAEGQDLLRRQQQRRHPSGMAEQGDARFYRKDRSAMWGLLSTTIVNADDGAYAGTLAMITDITDRRLAEMALRNSSQRMASVFNTVTNGLVVLNSEGTILESNAAAARMLGVAAAGGAALWPGVRESGEAFDYNEHPVHQALASGRSVRDVVMGVSQADGGISWLSVNVEPLRNEYGGASLAVASLTDISYRKRSEDAVRQGEQRLQEIIKMMPTGLFIKDPEGRFLLMNPACEQQFGFQFHELKGGDDRAFHSPDELAAIRRKDREAFAGGVLIDYEEAIWNPTLRQQRHLRTFKKPVFDERGQPAYLICMSIDITDSKRAERELRELNETLEERVQRRTAQLDEARKIAEEASQAKG